MMPYVLLSLWKKFDLTAFENDLELRGSKLFGRLQFKARSRSGGPRASVRCKRRAMMLRRCVKLCGCCAPPMRLLAVSWILVV